MTISIKQAIYTYCYAGKVYKVFHIPKNTNKTILMAYCIHKELHSVQDILQQYEYIQGIPCWIENFTEIDLNKHLDEILKEHT